MKAAVYTRVSTDDQKEEGTSLDSQLAACLEKAGELGYEVPEGNIFRETFSGLKIDRPQLSLLRQQAKDGDIDAVIAYSPDRLSRVGEDVLLLFKEFKLAGAKLILVREQFEDTITGKMVAFLFGWASELEASQIKERTRRGKKTKAEQGFLPQRTGIGIYGCRWDKSVKKRVPIEREAAVVKRIFEMIAEGKTRFEVARTLNDNNIPTKSGSKWHSLTLGRMITNTSYIGKTIFGKTHREGKTTKVNDMEKWHILTEVTPAIIDKGLFDRVQLKLKQSKELRKGRPLREYLLTSHVRCGICGSPLVGSTLSSKGKKFPYYHCRATYPTTINKATCHAGYIRAVEVEDVVWNEVRRGIENPQLILSQLKRKAKKPSNRNVDKEITEAKKKLDGYAKREENLLSLFEVDSITREELLQRLNKVKTEKSEAEKKLTQLTAIKKETIDIKSLGVEVNEYCGQLKLSLDNCTFTNKRLALEVLKVQVIATPEKIDIKMSVLLEYNTVERKREYQILGRKRNKRQSKELVS
jgi:site-specific DNA recombinase